MTCFQRTETGGGNSTCRRLRVMASSDCENRQGLLDAKADKASKFEAAMNPVLVAS